MAESRQIVQVPVPPALDMVIDAKPIEYTILDFLAHLVATEAAFNTDGPGIRAGARIEVAMREASAMPKGEQVLGIEHRDLLRIRRAAQKPMVGYPFKPAFRLAAFLDALGVPEEEAVADEAARQA